MYRHHVEPRVKLYSTREESFPIPLKHNENLQNYTYKLGCYARTPHRASTTAGTSMGQEICLILGQASLSLFY